MQVDSPTAKPKSDSKTSEPGFLSNIKSSIASLTKRKRSARALRDSSKESKTVATMLPVPVPKFIQKDDKEIFKECASDPEIHYAYEAKRGGLVNDEAKASWDAPDKVSKGVDKHTKDSEERTAKIVKAIREYERNVTFGNKASEDIPGPETLDMGGQFLTNKQRIEHKSLLYKISRHVPKGALLHLHFNAELNPEMLLKQARGKGNMYVWSIKPLLNADDLETTEMVFKVMPETTTSCDIFQASYEGQGKNCNNPQFNDRVWMRWKDFRTTFAAKFSHLYKQPEPDPAVRPGPRTCSESVQVVLEPAEYWIKQKMVLSETEAYNPAQTVNGVWARFNQATRCFKGLLNYEDVYKWYIGEAIDRLIAEKIMYVELRPMLLDKSIPTNNGEGIIDNAQQMRLIVDCVREKQKELSLKYGDTDKFPFMVKVIYCTPRSIPTGKMRSEMEDCIKLKREFGDLICGFDLVGAEDRPNSLNFYARELRAFQETCKRLDLDIPFLFHAGETLLDTGGSAEPENSNLYDSVALEAKRIGHGFSLMKHPRLVEEFRPIERQNDPNGKGRPGICVELCPISNELLHLCRNIKEHPYPELLAAGVPCCVNSDNPSLFSNSMCHEFYQIMVGSPTMSIYSWKQLALWSLKYSCLNDTEKARGEQIFLESFQKFCERVIKYCDVLVKDKNGNDMVENGNFVINEEEAAKMYADLPDLDVPK